VRCAVRCHGRRSSPRPHSPARPGDRGPQRAVPGRHGVPGHRRTHRGRAFDLPEHGKIVISHSSLTRWSRAHSRSLPTAGTREFRKARLRGACTALKAD
jgi:hypothetical protein